MSDDALQDWATRHGIAHTALRELRELLSDQDALTLDPFATAAPATQPPEAASFGGSWLDDTQTPDGATHAEPQRRATPGSAPFREPDAPLRLLGALGSGGMGEVLQMYDEALHRTIALKAMHPDLAARTDARRRFTSEAQITAQLQHPGVIPVHQIGVLPDGRPYFTMKKIEGHTLRREIARLHDTSPARPDAPRPTLRAVLSHFRRVCETLAYAHDRGVLHRDLKPDNIMVGRFGQVHVLDWGLAKVADRDEPAWRKLTTVRGESDQTQLGSASGTPRYMSPEQARGRHDLAGPWTDVYALGLILWEILEGRSPFADVSDDLLTTVATRTVPSPGDHHPSGLVRICRQALSPEPIDRYPDAEALARDLTDWMDGAQRRTEALALVDRAEPLVAREEDLRSHAAEAHQQGKMLLADVPAHAPLEQKEPGWARLDAAQQLGRDADGAAWDRVALLEAALTRDHGLPEALDALAGFHLQRHTQAVIAHDEAAAERHLRQLTRYDRGTHAAYIRGDGRLTLHTDPPGARVDLHRIETQGRRAVPVWERVLGTTPLENVQLPMGSYLLTLNAPGHDVVRYPVHIARQARVEGIAPGSRSPTPIWLPPKGTLGPDDIYVPAGWFISGTHKPIPHTTPETPLWLDAWVVKRHVVTNTDFLQFLDALVDEGREEEALKWVPRERASRPGERGAMCYGRNAQGHFCLVPDAEGDLWNPRWPVFLVSWDAADAYSRWVAERTGLPWQLPPEMVWEKAARGVDGREYPWGPYVDPSFACLRDSRAGRPLPATIDAFPLDESIYGVRGVAGNVREWCQERFSDAPDKAHERNLRGGCWFFAGTSARCANRYALGHHNRADTIGFRIARPLITP